MLLCTPTSSAQRLFLHSFSSESVFNYGSGLILTGWVRSRIDSEIIAGNRSVGVELCRCRAGTGFKLDPCRILLQRNEQDFTNMFYVFTAYRMDYCVVLLIIWIRFHVHKPQLQIFINMTASGKTENCNNPLDMARGGLSRF